MEARVELPRELIIARVADLKRDIGVLLDTSTQIVVDASGVEDADTAGLQLLLAFTREARSRSIALRWRLGGPALITAARRLGLETELGLLDTELSVPGP